MILKLKEEESKFNEREMNLDNEILIKATEITDVAELEMKEEFDKKVSDIECKYEQKKNVIYSVTTGAVIYGFVVTMLKLLSSVRMKSDIVDIFKNVCFFIISAISINYEIISSLWTYVNHKDNRIVWIMLAVLITFLIIVIQFTIIVAGIKAVIAFIVWIYSDGKFDFATVIIMLVSLIIIVWTADKLTFIGWNLVVVWLLVQFGVIVGRAFIENVI